MRNSGDEMRLDIGRSRHEGELALKDRLTIGVGAGFVTRR